MASLSSWGVLFSPSLLLPIFRGAHAKEKCQVQGACPRHRKEKRQVKGESRRPRRNGSAGQARPLPLDCFLQLRAQRPGASALCAVCAKPLSSLRASLLGARDGAGRQPGPRAQRGAPVTWTEHEATPWATSFPAPQHWQERQASPGSHRRCGTLHGKSKSNGKLVTVCRPNGAS